MNAESFASLLVSITATAADQRLDVELERVLNENYPANGVAVGSIRAACDDAIAAGWMCSREAAGIRYGRVLRPGPTTHGFSVDVVDMNEVVGPHHRHPRGEIDLVMPLDATATFDGRPAGWVVYGPDSAHHPTVRGGRAIVLYLLPDGAIEFTKS